MGYSEEKAEEVYLHILNNNLNDEDHRILEETDEYLKNEAHKSWEENGFVGGRF